jgi:wyosine [tRNA(Phe)-imidazoG37] synthetase (radical SAM superfamily)
LSGSGEATMAKDLPDYIKAVKSRGLKAYINTNGAKLNGKFMEEVINAGIDLVRFSVIGYNKEKYIKWMDVDNFNLIKSNIKETMDYVRKVNSKCNISTYHLITDNDKLDFEVQEYKKLVSEFGCKAYIWKMHNFSGNYINNINPRQKTERKTCGRPFADELTVRAGGLDGQMASVTACCQTLGPPNESKSVMGHLDTETFEEIYFGKRYQHLRKVHKEGNFDELDYCKDCDYLYEEPESLVWTNDKGFSSGQMLEVGSDFNIFKYDKNRVF